MVMMSPSLRRASPQDGSTTSSASSTVSRSIEPWTIVASDDLALDLRMADERVRIAPITQRLPV